jgi:hypothetical protein
MAIPQKQINQAEPIEPVNGKDGEDAEIGPDDDHIESIKTIEIADIGFASIQTKDATDNVRNCFGNVEINLPDQQC